MTHPTGAPDGSPAAPTVIFDLGGVVLRWDPRLAYGQVLPEHEIDDFLAEISFPAWNARADAGRPWSEGEQELITAFPHRAEAVRAYRRHFTRAIPGMVPGTNAIIAELQRARVRLLGLTNWAADTFAETRPRFGVLGRFESIMVSGEERLAKPDPAIFARLLDRHSLDAGRTVFVDDSPVNCAAAEGLGVTALRFTDAGRLRAELVRLGLLGPAEPVEGPVLHLAERGQWERARRSGDFPWSTRGITFEQEGYVHCSFPDQLAGVRRRSFADLADADLVVLELGDGSPVLVEDLGAGPYPHLFAPVDPRRVTAGPYPRG